MADPLGPSILTTPDALAPVILTVFFLIVSALIYALNAALPHIDEGDLRKSAEQGSGSAGRILRLLNRFDNGYGEIRMSYALLIAAAYISLMTWLSPVVTQWLQLSALLVDLILLIPFGALAFALTAIIPGAFAANRPQRTLETVSGISEFVITLLTPITGCAYLIGKAMLAPFHLKPNHSTEHVTEEEILMMVDIGEEKGAIEADEKEMIENIFEFNNMNAEDCMIHRKDITALDIETPEEEILTTIVESGRSRFPVYEDSIDNVIGILTSRDYLISRCSDSPKPFRELIRPAHFVPESVRTDVLFREMQTRKQHMAIVIDEYGGTSGLITLEDLLEELVGDIYDEFDPKEEQDVTTLPDGRWRVSGSTELETLNEALEIELPLEEEYDTLGGLVFSHLTEIPADGECPVVECFGLRISVTEIADRRVEWAIVEKLPEPETGEDDE